MAVGGGKIRNREAGVRVAHRRGDAELGEDEKHERQREPAQAADRAGGRPFPGDEGRTRHRREKAKHHEKALREHAVEDAEVGVSRG